MAENELMLSEFNLWGGSLKIDVMRVLIENISSLLAPKKITIISWKTSVPEAYRIPIYLLRLDASANGSIFLKAKWGIVAKDGRTVVSIREFSITKPIKGNDYKDIVYAMSDVLADFSKEIVSIIHSHLPETGDLITSTDICTLMLYEKFAKWKSHKVVSQKYLSTWDCAKDELTVVEMGAVEKMVKEQGNANPAKQK